MKNILVCIALLILSGCASIQTPGDTNIAVSEILKQLQFTIDKIGGNKDASSLPPLKEAEIKLTTIVGIKNSTKGSLIISGKYENHFTDSNVLTLVLKPRQNLGTDERKSKDYKVAEHILAAASAIDKNDTYLELKSLTYESGLKIEKIKGVGLEIELVGVGTESGRTNTSTNSHSMKLVFEKKTKQDGE